MTRTFTSVALRVLAGLDGGARGLRNFRRARCTARFLAPENRFRPASPKHLMRLPMRRRDLQGRVLSVIRAQWPQRLLDPKFPSLLDFAEACDVPVAGRAEPESVTHVKVG